MEWAAFWIAIAGVAVARQVPSWIRAMAESKCEHDWTHERSGVLSEDDGKRVGDYSQYRCTKCGAFRQYD